MEMKYKIIESGTAGSLATEVNKLIKDGWVLVGVLVLVKMSMIDAYLFKQ